MARAVVAVSSLTCAKVRQFSLPMATSKEGNHLQLSANSYTSAEQTTRPFSFVSALVRNCFANPQNSQLLDSDNFVNNRFVLTLILFHKLARKRLLFNCLKRLQPHFRPEIWHILSSSSSVLESLTHSSPEPCTSLSSADLETRRALGTRTARHKNEAKWRN